MDTQASQLKEEWRPVVGFEPSYMISNLGRAKSIDRDTIWYQPRWKVTTRRFVPGRMLEPRKHGRLKNYIQFCLGSTSPTGQKRVSYQLAHRMVATAFIPNPLKKPVVNHMDGNCSNNCVSNLEWATYQENTIDGMKRGTFTTKRGINHKLDELQIVCIKILYDSGKISMQAISKVLNIPETTVSSLLKRL